MSQAGPPAWAEAPIGGSGRESWILPFAAALAAALAGVGVAAAASWIDWRWVLLALSATAVVLPCGVLVLQGRLDVFEPLTWSESRALILRFFFSSSSRGPLGTLRTRTSSTPGG